LLLVLIFNKATGRAIIQLSEESRDNAIVLFPGTNRTVTLEEANHVLRNFGEGDWIVMQNEMSSGPEIMQAAKERGTSQPALLGRHGE
jgi:ribokinase